MPSAKELKGLPDSPSWPAQLEHEALAARVQLDREWSSCSDWKPFGGDGRLRGFLLAALSQHSNLNSWESQETTCGQPVIGKLLSLCAEEPPLVACFAATAFTCCAIVVAPLAGRINFARAPGLIELKADRLSA